MADFPHRRPQPVSPRPELKHSGVTIGPSPESHCLVFVESAECECPIKAYYLELLCCPADPLLTVPSKELSPQSFGWPGDHKQTPHIFIDSKVQMCKKTGKQWAAKDQAHNMLGMTSAINNFTSLSNMQGILGLKTHLNQSLLSFPPMKTPTVPVIYSIYGCWCLYCPKFTHVTGVGQHIHNHKQVCVQEAIWVLLYYSSNCKRQLQNDIKAFSQSWKTYLVFWNCEICVNAQA